ncbi:MAG: nuclear transport factor 2 family protein [Bacteroidota bacterium]
MKFNTLLIAAFLLLLWTDATAQSAAQTSASEITQITATLMDYIEGTANGEPDRLRKAFHPDFNLYTVTQEDSLRIRSGAKYIANVKEGKKSNRVGRILSIDFEKDAAIAKVEIVMPGWRIFTDYFLLLKYEDSWKIVHKSYTWRPFPAPPVKK